MCEPDLERGGVGRQFAAKQGCRAGTAPTASVTVSATARDSDGCERAKGKRREICAK